MDEKEEKKEKEEKEEREEKEEKEEKEKKEKLEEKKEKEAKEKRNKKKGRRRSQDLLGNSKKAGYHDVEDTAKAQTEQLGSEIQNHSFIHPGIQVYRYTTL